MRCAFGLGGSLANSVMGQEPPKIVFPAPAYPVKVVGAFTPDFEAFVLDAFEAMPEVSAAQLRARPSRNGRFLAVTVTFTAQSEGQLAAIFADLQASGRVGRPQADRPLRGRQAYEPCFRASLHQDQGPETPDALWG